MSFNNVGKVWTVNSFEQYLKGLKKPDWIKAVCLHHTAFPDLKIRPKGLTIDHIENMKYGYIHERGWNRGPHLFIDEDQIFGMTPLIEKGIHAVKFNSNSIGIEVLGDYDEETPFSGRGLECWKTAAKATKTLYDWIGVSPTVNNLYFHRDDPNTSKTCPGTLIKKEWVLSLMNEKQSEKVLISSNLPVIDYVVKNKGYSQSEAISLLKNVKGLFYFGNDWLEGAFYDSKVGSTVASEKELKSIKNK